MDYERADEIMEAVMALVYDYLKDYPDALEDAIGAYIPASDVEEAFRKVKNG